MAARPPYKASGQQPVETQLALAYAGLGRKADAIPLGQEGAQLVPVSRDALAGPRAVLDLVEVYVRSGDYGCTVNHIESLLSIPFPRSLPTMRVARHNPR